jgi:hypothetical protein
LVKLVLGGELCKELSRVKIIEEVKAGERKSSPERLGWGEVYAVWTYSPSGEDTFCSRTPQTQIN